MKLEVSFEWEIWQISIAYIARLPSRFTVPFNEWIKALRDRKGRAIIRTRITRLQLGLFGDAKAVGDGVSELRISFGPGYRVANCPTHEQ